jgi:hypothetical protein
LLIFGGLPAPPQNKKIYFRHLLFLAANSLAAGNYLLFSAADLGPPKISYFQRVDLARRKYGLIFDYFFLAARNRQK